MADISQCHKTYNSLQTWASNINWTIYTDNESGLQSFCKVILLEEKRIDWCVSKATITPPPETHEFYILCRKDIHMQWIMCVIYFILLIYILPTLSLSIIVTVVLCLSRSSFTWHRGGNSLNSIWISWYALSLMRHLSLIATIFANFRFSASSSLLLDIVCCLFLLHTRALL